MMMMIKMVTKIATVDEMTAVVVVFAFSFVTSWLAKVEQLDDDD